MIAHWSAMLGGLDRKLFSLAIWLLIAMATMIPLEKVFQLRQQDVLRKDFWQDILYFFIGGIAPAVAVVGINALIVFILQGVLPGRWFGAMQDLPGWARVAAIVAVGDFGYYWAHRWAHAIGVFWRFHSIHHSSTQLDWLVATRAHPVEICYVRAASFIPVFALGLVDASSTKQNSILLLAVAFNTLWAFFIHSNVRLNLGWLEHIVSTPRFHHWHHANDGPGTANKNYAALLPLWDRLFGSLYLPASGFPQAYGSSTCIPAGLARQLVFPLLPPVKGAGEG